MIKLANATLLALAVAASSCAWAQPKPADDSVHQSWGGKAGIRAVMEDFVPRLQADRRRTACSRALRPCTGTS